MVIVNAWKYVHEIEQGKRRLDHVVWVRPTPTSVGPTILLVRVSILSPPAAFPTTVDVLRRNDGSVDIANLTALIEEKRRSARHPRSTSGIFVFQTTRSLNGIYHGAVPV